MPSPLCLNTHSTLNMPRIKSCCKNYSDTKLLVNCKHTWRLSLEEITNLSTTTRQRKTATEGKAGCKCHNTVRWGRLIGKVSACETVNPWELCLVCLVRHRSISAYLKVQIHTQLQPAHQIPNNHWIRHAPHVKLQLSAHVNIPLCAKHVTVYIHVCLTHIGQLTEITKVHLQQGCTILAKNAIRLLNVVMAIWLTINTKILNHTVLVLFCCWLPVEPREWVDWKIIK